MAKERTKPYPDPMANPKQAAFLAAYAKLGNITAAAAASGCDPSNLRAHLPPSGSFSLTQTF